MSGTLAAQEPRSGLYLDGVAIAVTIAMGTPCTVEVSIIAVRTPLHLLCTSPLLGSCATCMSDILRATWAERSHVSILWVLLFHIHKDCSGQACDLNVIAIATGPTMSSVLVVQICILFVWAPLHLLPHLHCPLGRTRSASMCHIIGSLRAIRRYQDVWLWVLTVDRYQDQFALWCGIWVPKPTER